MVAEGRWLDLSVFDAPRGDLFGSGSIESFERSEPPVGPVIACALLLAISLLTFVIGNDAADWIGYITGSWLLAIAAIVFRRIDRKRSRSNGYLEKASLNRVVVAMLAVGLISACLHAFFLAKEHRFV
jgi:hypothetical protein